MRERDYYSTSMTIRNVGGQVRLDIDDITITMTEGQATDLANNLLAASGGWSSLLPNEEDDDG